MEKSPKTDLSPASPFGEGRAFMQACLLDVPVTMIRPPPTDLHMHMANPGEYAEAVTSPVDVCNANEQSLT